MGPFSLLCLNDSRSAGSGGFLFSIASSALPISSPCFKLKAPLPRRPCHYLLVSAGRSRTALFLSVGSYEGVELISIEMVSGGGCGGKPLVCGTPPGPLLTVIAALAQALARCFSGSACKHHTDAPFLWLSWNFGFNLPLMQMFQTYRGCVSVPLDAAVHRSSCGSTLGYSFCAFTDAGCLFLLRVIRLELSVRRTRESSLSCFCWFSSPAFSAGVDKVPDCPTRPLNPDGLAGPLCGVPDLPSDSIDCLFCLQRLPLARHLAALPAAAASGLRQLFSVFRGRVDTLQQTVHAAHVPS